MDGTTSRKINKETEDLNDPINKLNLADVLSTLLPPAARHTLLKHTSGTFSKLGGMRVRIASFSSLKGLK